MSPQLSCGNTCQIWTWYSRGNQCFGNGGKSGNKRNGWNWFSNPHPKTVLRLPGSISRLKMKPGFPEIVLTWALRPIKSEYPLPSCRTSNFDDTSRVNTKYIEMCCVKQVLWKKPLTWQCLTFVYCVAILQIVRCFLKRQLCKFGIAERILFFCINLLS